MNSKNIEQKELLLESWGWSDFGYFPIELLKIHFSCLT